MATLSRTQSFPPELQSALSLLANNPSQPTSAIDEPITTEELASLIDRQFVKKLAGRVESGRSIRQLAQSIEQNESSLRTFCESVFYSYLPKEAQTETLGMIFKTKFLKLDPETKIAIYEKWFEDLPYHEFSHLTAMSIHTSTKQGPFALPAEIGKFTHLRELSFSPSLLSLSPEIKRLSNLTTLDLRCYSGNNLDNLRDTCRGLPQLREIIFEEDFQRTGQAEVLQKEFPRIKIVFQKNPPAAASLV